jgi:hypothetical protein
MGSPNYRARGGYVHMVNLQVARDHLLISQTESGEQIS